MKIAMGQSAGTKVSKELGHFFRNRERTCRANEWSKVRRLKVKSERRRERMDFDTALAEAGELGLWQWAVSRKERSKKKTRSWKKHPNNKIQAIIQVLLLLVPAALLPGMWSVLFVFAGYVPKHRWTFRYADSGFEEGAKMDSSFPKPKVLLFMEHICTWSLTYDIVQMQSGHLWRQRGTWLWPTMAQLHTASRQFFQWSLTSSMIFLLKLLSLEATFRKNFQSKKAVF